MLSFIFGVYVGAGCMWAVENKVPDITLKELALQAAVWPVKIYSKFTK